MNLENVLEMWKKDNVIDEMALDESSRETAKLHSKLTVLKSDMDKYYDSDPIIQEHQKKIAYQEELCSTLKEILDSIKWRHQTIKNMIEWRKFTSGI